MVYQQDEISAFIYSMDKKLIPYKKKLLPEANEKIFMKQGIRDSVKKVILNNSNITFDLHEEKLTLSLNSDYIVDNKAIKKWLKGDIVYFDWIRNQFVISKMEFQFGE